MKKLLTFISMLIGFTFFVPNDVFAGKNKKDQQRNQSRKKASSQTRKKIKRTVADTHQDLPQTPPTSQKRKKMKTTAEKSPQKAPPAAPPPPPPAPEFSMTLVKKSAPLTPQNQESKDETKKGQKKFFKMTQGLKELLQVGKGTLKQIIPNTPYIQDFNFRIPILKMVNLDLIPQAIGGKKPYSQFIPIIDLRLGDKGVEELKQKTQERQERIRYMTTVKSKSQAVFKEIQDSAELIDRAMIIESCEDLDKKTQEKNSVITYIDFIREKTLRSERQAVLQEMRDAAIFIDHEMIVESCEELDKKVQEKKLEFQKKKNKIKKTKKKVRLIKQLEEDREQLDAEKKQLMAQIDEQQKLAEEEKQRKKRWWKLW